MKSAGPCLVTLYSRISTETKVWMGQVSIIICVLITLNVSVAQPDVRDLGQVSCSIPLRRWRAESCSSCKAAFRLCRSSLCASDATVTAPDVTQRREFHHRKLEEGPMAAEFGDFLAQLLERAELLRGGSASTAMPGLWENRRCVVASSTIDPV